jgi:glyoxylase-like metal-dependent hydrolase (beta-lactamase superfamily II)
VVVSGDLVVNPIPFALSSYPSGWVRTLERIDSLPFDVLVPGHGDPLRDRTLLRAQIAIMRELLRLGREAKARGETVEQARARAMGTLRDRMVVLTGDRPADNQAFEIYLVDWFLHRVFEELDGPLSNDIAPIPAHPPGS